MPAALVRSTPGPGLAGASWDSTTPRAVSIVSFAWQHGQARWRAPSGLFAMGVFYAFFLGRKERAELVAVALRATARNGGATRARPATLLNAAYDVDAVWAPRLPRRFRASAFSRMALMQKAMCSSRGMPSSSAPLRTSSRLTPRAKALSFILFFTEST